MGTGPIDGKALHTKPGFRFLDLPENIRVKVYTHLLVKQTPHRPYLRRPIRRYFRAVDPASLLLQAGLCLLRTSKQIHRETTEILYGRNTFHLDSHAYPVSSLALDASGAFAFPDLHPPQSEPCVEFLTRLAVAGNLSKVQCIILDFEGNEARQHGYHWEETSQFEFMTVHEEYLDPDCFPKFHKPRNAADSDSAETLQDDTGTSLDWLEEDLDEDFYPKWRRVNGLRHNFQQHVGSALEYLAQCKLLLRLEIWFPDPQRFAAGWVCISKGGPISEAIQRLTNVRDLVVHGLEELGTLHGISNAVNVTAEFHSSPVRPHLHVEAGRPSLRAVSGWKVQYSSKDRIAFRRIPLSLAGADFFAGLAPEIRFTIFEFFIASCWEDHCDRQGLLSHHYISQIEGDQDFCWNDPCVHLIEHPRSFEEIPPAGRCSILRASKLICREAASVLYNTFPFRLRNDQPKLLLQFLHQIGEENRKSIRHLLIDWNSSIFHHTRRLLPLLRSVTPDLRDEDEYDNYYIQDLRDAHEHDCGDCYCQEGLTGIRTAKTVAQIQEELVSQVFRTLTLLRDIPVLDWLYLAPPLRMNMSDENGLFFKEDHFLFKEDLFANDRFFYFCSKIPKVRCLWLEQWHLSDLPRCEALARSVKAEKIFVRWISPSDKYGRRSSPLPKDFWQKKHRDGWVYTGGVLSKCL
ncbi:hypothetical protein MMC20_000141 [Loxospora ochrophaea]|nr:hypothetical protein [Loxospora ochrophaea]